ncbi:lysozyme [Algoriphagus aquaeductus]|uniref:Lysozyme n=1 Tax=Algoriphagus aquaeductus TaxID=475299 RepID=A0A326RRP3_9BACT|nr:glycoside hydrolase family 25 protein [Algoriphagus aquaeductus]PZV76398.1 lysozyme [Algoriphagus aquaeductus]
MPRKRKSGPWIGISLLIIAIALGSGYLVKKFRRQINQRLSDYTQKAPPFTEALKFEHVFSNFPEGILGIDVSEYQGRIDFAGLQLQLQNRQIEFVVVRATMGKDGKDSRFKQNWEGFRPLPIMRGAYHYYRPNENSTLQAQNFIKTAQLKSGDLIPVLDIEKHSTIQSRDKLREGLKNWLKIVEAHYGVKPMIYTGDRFFWEVLHENGFDDYPIWVANYNPIVEPETEDWTIWQFSEKGSLPGIGEKIDLNVLIGGKRRLEELVIP